MSTACGYSAPALNDKLRLWVGCSFCDKWTLAPVKKSCLSVSPPALVPLSWWLLRWLTLPLFVSFPSLHLARSLWLSEAQLCVVRDHILLTLLQEFWYISSLIDFLSSAVFFFFFYRPLPPLPSPSFFLTKSVSSLIPYKHTNRISISQEGEERGESKKVRGRDKITFSIRVNSEKMSTNK